MKPAAFLLAALAACAPDALMTGPSVVLDDFRGRAIRVQTPTTEMLAGYARAEWCSGRRGDVRKVRFHIVPGESFTWKGRELYGLRDGDDLYVAERQAHRIWLWCHESLHHLGYPDDPHPFDVFNTKCKAHWPYPSDTL